VFDRRSSRAHSSAARRQCSARALRAHLPGGRRAQHNTVAWPATCLTAARRWGAPAGLQARSRPHERRVARPPGSWGRDSRRRCDEVRRPTLPPARRRTRQNPAHTHRRLHGDGELGTILAPRTRRVAAASHAARLADGLARCTRGRALATAVPKARAASPRTPGAAT
jgi:hypothetical protein